MRVGGYIDRSGQALPAWLHSANCGVTLFSKTRWWVSCWDWWVLDVTLSDQFQRICGEAKFLRKAGVAALYQPGLRFEEWQEAGGSARESWILFSAAGDMKDSLHALTSPGGYCHFEDPERLVARGLQTISEALFHRRAGFQWLAQGTFLTLLSQIVMSRPLDAALRALESRMAPRGEGDLMAVVENFIWSRIGQPLQVADLARHAGLGLSAFAHRYRTLAGESPYRTIIRLKMEAAKRMLAEEAVSVKETADRLGFSSEFHFSRCFKRLEGQSPSAHVMTMNAKR